MNVKLVSLTKSFIEEADLSPEELIVYVARVSNPSNQLNTETSDKLINYLIKNKHWSPFEMVDMTVEIVTSRAIAQQILRHRSFSFQEFSQRYSVATEYEVVQIRRQADKNRQSSSEEFDPITFEEHTEINDRSYTIHPEQKASEEIESLMNHADLVYHRLINAGVAKECARMILPLTTQTKIYMKGSVRSWIHYLQIRLDDHTQLEHRQIAEQIKTIFQEKFPNIAKSLN